MCVHIRICIYVYVCVYMEYIYKCALCIQYSIVVLILLDMSISFQLISYDLFLDQ